MHFAGTPSWQIRSGVDRDLTLALYLRDVTGLGRYASADPDLPPLDPAVPVGGGPDVLHPDELAAAIRQWQLWWPRVLRVPSPDDPPSGPPHRPELDDLPVLRGLLDAHTEGFVGWMRQVEHDEQARVRRGSLGLTHLVNGYEGELGRAVRPFVLHLREVPVQGSAGWVVEPTVVVVSTALSSDEPALEEFLRPVIDHLA